MSNTLLKTLETEVLLTDDDGDSLILVKLYNDVILALTKSRVKMVWIRYFKKDLGSGDGVGS